MNRAERRRDAKRQPAGVPPPPPLEVRPLLQEATALHRAGRLDRAEPLYEQVLAMRPGYAEALHLLGLLRYQTGRIEPAVELLSEAVRRDDSNAAYCFNLGVALQKLGRQEDAATAYEKAVRLNSRYVEALVNLGNVRLDQGRMDEAETVYRRVLGINPSYVEAHNNLGVALRERGNPDEAEAAYRQALTLKPDHLEALCNLGTVLMDQDRLDEAVASYEQALHLKPDYLKALSQLGFARLWRGERAQAFDCFRRAGDLKHNHGRPVVKLSPMMSRIKHDAEQTQYLRARALLPDGAVPYLEALQSLNQRVRYTDGLSTRLAISREEADAIAPSFNRIMHYGPGDEIPAGAINREPNVAAIEASYVETRPGIVYVDGLLTQGALATLRRFCWESTIWKRDYRNGYVGAFVSEGFASPLLLQIADELRATFPAIFQRHRLTQAWAFKQDSALRALNLHADAAAVNVNFWITPDDANLDPTGGGLIVWDKEAPAEWNFAEYNDTRHEPKVRDFLRAGGAKAVTVPYRANRAAIFNSNLFHESDRCCFKDDYQSRRINITLLYGKRPR